MVRHLAGGRKMISQNPVLTFSGSIFVNVNKKLNVTMKDNTPCFYIDAFEEIDAFEIQSIFAIKQVDNEASEYNEIVWDTPKIHIPFTAIVGKDPVYPLWVKKRDTFGKV